MTAVALLITGAIAGVVFAVAGLVANYNYPQRRPGDDYRDRL